MITKIKNAADIEQKTERLIPLLRDKINLLNTYYYTTVQNIIKQFVKFDNEI